MVAEEHLYFCPFFEDNEHTTVDHQVDIAPKDIDNLNGTIHLHILGHIDQHAVLGKHGVEGCYGILSGLGEFSIVFVDELRMVMQRADYHAFGQMALSLVVSIESIVDHEIEAGTQIGHIATEGLVWIDGNLETVEVQTVVRSKELCYVGIFIALYLSGGEATRRKLPESLVTHGVHRLRCMRGNHLPRLLIELNVLLFA